MVGLEFACPQVLHTLPGRLRIHVPGWSKEGLSVLEKKLAQVPGVHSAQASRLTGNILIHFDPQTSDPATLVAGLYPRESLTAAGKDRPINPNPPDSTVPKTDRKPAAPGRQTTIPTRTNPRKNRSLNPRQVARVLEKRSGPPGLPWIGSGSPDHSGRNLVDRLLKIVDILANLMARNPLSLLLGCIEAGFLAARWFPSVTGRPGWPYN
jgi:hypothetical protein